MPFFITGYPDPSAAPPDRAPVNDVDMTIVVGALVGTGVVLGCAVNALALPAMSVTVDPGTVQSNSTELYVYGGTVAIAAADTDNPRFDLVVVDSTGTLQVRSVSPEGGVVFPVLTAGDVALAAIYVPPNITEIDPDNVTDKRAFIPGVRYPGDIEMTARVTNPAAWYMCDGAAYDRTVDASLFNAITVTSTGTFTSGSKVVTGIASTTNFVPGASLSGANITVGSKIATIDSATQITMDTNASATGSASFVMAPWGVGDSSTTFNVPDFRDRSPVGPHLADGVAPVLQSATTTNGALDANGQMTVSPPAGVQAGDLIVIVTGRAINAFTTPAGFALYASNSGLSGGFFASVEVFYKVATASEPGSYTFVGGAGAGDAGNSYVASVLRITGQHPTLPFDAKSLSGAAAGTSLAVAGLTTSHNNCLVFSVAAIDAAAVRTFTESVGTEQWDQGNLQGSDASCMAGNTRTQATAGVVASNTFTASATARVWTGICFAIRPKQTTTIAVLGGVATHSFASSFNTTLGGAAGRVVSIDGVTTGGTIDNTPPNASVNFMIKR